MNITAFSGILCIVSATTFFARWAMGSSEAVAWPRACFMTRVFLFSMGLVFSVRGLSLLTGHGRSDGGGTLAMVVLTGYAITMCIREVKAMPPRMRRAPRSLKPSAISVDYRR